MTNLIQGIKSLRLFSFTLLKTLQV